MPAFFMSRRRRNPVLSACGTQKGPGREATRAYEVVAAPTRDHAAGIIPQAAKPRFERLRDIKKARGAKRPGLSRL